LEKEGKKVTRFSVVCPSSDPSVGTDDRLDIPLEGVSHPSQFWHRWDIRTDRTVVARYLVGLLHSRTPSFFETHHPVSFSTIATPVSFIHRPPGQS
jgi:hypothetical protein